MSAYYPEGGALDPMAPWNDDDLDPDEIEQARFEALIDEADNRRKER